MSYARILSRIHNVPLAIHQDKLDILSSKVILPLLVSEKPLADTSVRPRNRDIPATTGSKVGIINIFDSLVSKGGAGDSGFTSYQGVTNNVLSAIDNGATKLVFYIDSPGGEVSGLFGLAEFIGSLPSEYGVETIAITDGMAASAAYVIASAAQQVYATSSSILGSIGVIMTRVNVSEADKQDGVEYQILRSKSEKALGNPHEPISNKATEDAIKLLAELDTIMNDTVNKFRPNLSIEQIQNLNGNTVLAEEALSLNLIDGIVASFNDGLTKVKTGTKMKTFNNNLGANMPRTLEEYQAEETRLLGEIQTLKASQEQTIKSAIQTEQERILGIMEAGTKFKVPQAAVTKRIKANTSLVDTVSMFEDIAEIAGSNPSQHIETVNTTSTVNPQTVSMTEDQKYISGLLAAVDKIKSAQPKVMR